MKLQSVAIDGLKRDGQFVVGEISYTYVSHAVAQCPGHWKLHGEPETGDLIWIEGSLRPEDAILDDFIAQLDAHEGVRVS